MLTEAEVKREFGIEFDTSGKLSMFGGFKPFLAFLRRMRAKEQLEGLFGEYCGRAMLQLMIGILAGADDMDEVERVGRDKLIRKYLGRAVCSTQIKRNLDKVSKTQLEVLHRFVMKLALDETMSHLEQDEAVWIDADATSKRKYGRQEGVEHGYIEKDKIDKCYQYMFFRLANLHTFLHGTIRGGAAHSQNGFEDYLRRFLPLFNGRRINLRADSAYFNERAFNLCAAHNTVFYMRAPMSESRRAQASSDEIEWVSDPDDASIEYGSYATQTKECTPWREVFRRKMQADSKLLLFPSYDYLCVATNNMTDNGWQVFKDYNGRANIENNIKELKNDYKLGHIVTNRFDTNDCITQVTILGYVLMQHFKRLALDNKMQRMTLSTLRWRVFNIPTMLLSGGRRHWQRIYNVFTKPEAYREIFTRIKHRLSPLYRPPDLKFLFAP